MEAAVCSPIHEAQRKDLQQRLVANFHALLFHREGYRPSQVPQELIEQIAAVVEAKAFLHVVRAAELGMSSRQMVQTYAKEAATLLLAEVERYTVPLEAPAGGSHSGNSVDLQQLSLNEFSGGLRSIQTAPSQQHRPHRPHDAAWGWLVPGSRMLPYVVLKGAGVAIGRGKEALWAIGGAASVHGTPRTCLANGGDRHLTEVLKRNLGFVEVADGRVSRLHCIISLGPSGGQAVLEDCSSNGTFLNHRKLAKGESVPLEDGDRISLVLSVAPLVEQYFVFRCGDPRDPELAGSDEHSWVGSTHSTTGVFSPGAMHSASPSGGVRPSSAAIFRTATSRYTTAEQSTLEDLKCQICLNTLRQCVALEPCGHNFCATCLSHHLGNTLQSGLQLSCPFRCPPPERIIINYAVRALIDLLSTNSRSLSGPLCSRAGSMGTAVAAAAVNGSGTAAPRSSRATASMPSAFGQAPGSYNNLTGLAGTPSAVPSPGQQQQHGSGNGQQQQQQQQQQAGSPPPGSAGLSPQGQSSSSSGHSIPRVASAASASSLEGGVGAAAAAGGGGGGGGGAGLPGVAEEPGSSSSTGANRSRFAAAGAAVGGNGLSSADMSRAASVEPDFYTLSMNVLCPLDDECLPLEAANLKTRQVEVALNQLKDSTLDHDDHLVCLEALARLAWSDDSVRQLIANTGGVRSLVGVMQLHEGSDSIQCNGCLALMSLVRGEGEVCQSNQWHVAKAGAIEVIAQAMVRFRDSNMVQLSVLLCLIPLTLENAMMQAHVTQECLPHIIAALDNHMDFADIQTKALVLLGVLIQGDDAVHDAVRIRQLEAGVPRRVTTALRQHGTVNDDVLWAALFTLAVLVRDDSAVFNRAASALVAAGVFRVLEGALEEYKQRHADENTDPDEMILSAGDYLLRVLEPVQQQHTMRKYMLVAAAGVGSALAAGLLLRRLWSRGSDSSSSSSSKGSSSCSNSSGSSIHNSHASGSSGSSSSRSVGPGVLSASRASA